MTLVDKLRQLDETISHRFEKIADQAYNNLGLGKYDLVRLTEGAGDMCYSGFGIYSIIGGIIMHSIPMTAAGIVSSLVGVYLYKRGRVLINLDEKLENHELEHTGAVRAPQYDAGRPLDFVLASWVAGAGIYTSLHGIEPISGFSGNVHNYTMAVALSLYAGSGSLLLWTMAKYFKNTPLSPPPARKKVRDLLASLLPQKTGKQVEVTLESLTMNATDSAPVN